MARFPNSILVLALSLTAPAFAQETPPADEVLVVTGGSVREAANAQEAEDLSLPELPTATDTSK